MSHTSRNSLFQYKIDVKIRLFRLASGGCTAHDHDVYLTSDAVKKVLLLIISTHALNMPNQALVSVNHFVQFIC